MARIAPEAVYEYIVAAVTRHPDGIGIDALSAALPALPRRTLQRHLARLVTAKMLRSEGQASARRYLPVAGHSEEPAEPEPTADADVWMSDAGLEVRRLIRRPISQRRPAGYQRAFLDGYRPNEDLYLSPTVRRHLHGLGRALGDGRPAGTYARQILDRLLIDLSWASSRLEGNTYTWLDTQNLIAFGQIAEGKDQREAQMILNHKGAIEMLVEDAQTIGFTREAVLTRSSGCSPECGRPGFRGSVVDSSGGRPGLFPAGVRVGWRRADGLFEKESSEASSCYIRQAVL